MSPLRATLSAVAVLATLTTGPGLAVAQTKGGPTAPAPAAGIPTPESRTAATAFLKAGFLDGFFGSFWTSFRTSFAAGVHSRAGGDLSRVERVTEEVVMPLFQARRPELEAQLLDVLASGLTAAQLRALLTETSAARVEAALAPVLPAMLAGVRVWADRIVADNRDAIVAAMRTRGVGR